MSGKSIFEQYFYADPPELTTLHYMHFDKNRWTVKEVKTIDQFKYFFFVYVRRVSSVGFIVKPDG